MDTDVHKNTEVDDVPYSTGQFHTGNQILHFQHIFPQDRLGQFVTGIPSGFAELFGDVYQCGFTDCTFFCSLFQAVRFQLAQEIRQIAAFLASQQIQQCLCCCIRLRMNACVIQDLLAFRNPQETGTLFESFGAQLGYLLQLRTGSKRSVFFPVGYNIFCGGGSQTCHLLQKTAGSGIGIYAD